MTNSTVLVNGRGAAQRIEALGMRCNDKEIPDPLGNETPVGWWIDGMCTMSGSASAGTPDGGTTPVNMRGTVALAVLPGRLLGIFSTGSMNSTNATADPAVWFSWSIPELRIETAGSKGIFRKRPAQITVRGQDATLVLSNMYRLWRNINRIEPWQEKSFLDALGVAE